MAAVMVGGGHHHHHGGGHGGLRGDTSGLPFAGVPDELRRRHDELAAEEPEIPLADEASVDFSARVPAGQRQPFTLRRFLLPHWRPLLGALALVVVETGAGLVGPVLTQIGIDEGIGGADRGVLVAVTLAYLGAIVLNVATSAARIAWTGRVGERLMLALRVRVFAHLQRLSLGWFTDEKAGRVLTRMTSDIDALSALFHDGLINMAVQALTVVVVSAVLFSYDTTLALVTVAVVVPAMVAATLRFRTASDQGYSAVRRRIADVLADLQESLAGMRLVAAHNRQAHNVARHQAILDRYREANVYTGRIGALYGPGSELVAVAGQAAVLIVGGQRVLAGQLSVGELTAFILFIATFFAPIQQLVHLYTTYQAGQAAAAKLRDLLATEPGVAEAPDAVELPPVEGEVCLESVSFGYSGEGAPVLHDVDLTVHPGETFALVGPTGAGKSTIAKLVTRFYDPSEGRVLIDGHDLRHVTLDSLRRQLGIVPQEPFLFAGSVRDNIAFARPDASDEELAEACRVLGIDTLIERLPQGLDTPVHERGSSLSSGQRQLLALARAFIARPRVLVLDEATSSLDLASEAVVERALDVLLEGRTAILIAHRLATAMRADRIAVVDDGRVREVGTHEELVAAGGRYATLYAAWARAAEPEAGQPATRARRRGRLRATSS
ncbi:MAG: ABC transporter ATP-binding protein/permease [Actinomycetota bacterium]|nr:ABC transporter ATP-binding protein/permease [Actinomycetota bacterium]